MSAEVTFKQAAVNLANAWKLKVPASVKAHLASPTFDAMDDSFIREVSSAIHAKLPAPTPTPAPVQPFTVDAIKNAEAGTIVYVPSGTFPGAVAIPDGVSVAGAGLGLSWLRGRITYGSNDAVSGVKLGDAGMAIRNRPGASHTVFRAVQFRGGGGSDSDSYLLLFADSCDHITLSGCNIECNLGVEDSAFSHGYNNLRITENAKPGGAHIDSLMFDSCHFGVSNGVRNGCPRMDIEAYTWDGGSGSYIHGWSNLVVTGCVFEPSDWYNIDLADAASPSGPHVSGPALIEGCALGGAGNYSLCIESPNGVVVRNNTIRRGANNTVKFGCGDMSAVNPGAFITGNVFDLLTDNGHSLGEPYFYIKGGDNQFTGNTVKAASGSRVFELQQARNNTITGNTLNVPASATLFVLDNGCGGNVTSPNMVNGV